MAKMTNEEADALDKYYTEHTIMPVRGKPGLFEERKIRMFAVDVLSAQYFTAKATAEHKTTELHGGRRKPQSSTKSHKGLVFQLFVFLCVLCDT
jgi:hypothetical protein